MHDVLGLDPVAGQTQHGKQRQRCGTWTLDLNRLRFLDLKATSLVARIGSISVLSRLSPIAFYETSELRRLHRETLHISALLCDQDRVRVKG